MTFDLLHRVRWANVARAAAVALALLLALAWPRLRAHSDALPPAIEAAPVAPAAPVKPAAAAKAQRATVPARVKEAKAPEGATNARRARATAVPKPPAAKRRARHRHRHRHARHRRLRSPRIAVSTRAPVPTYVVPPAASLPAAEFRP